VKKNWEAHFETIKDQIPKDEVLSRRNNFSSKSWENETDEFKAELRQQLEEEYQEALKVWNNRGQWEASAESYNRFDMSS
jgi:hypothetical protein